VGDEFAERRAEAFPACYRLVPAGAFAERVAAAGSYEEVDRLASVAEERTGLGEVDVGSLDPVVDRSSLAEEDHSPCHTRVQVQDLGRDPDLAQRRDFQESHARHLDLEIAADFGTGLVEDLVGSRRIAVAAGIEAEDLGIGFAVGAVAEDVEVVERVGRVAAGAAAVVAVVAEAAAAARTVKSDQHIPPPQ